MASPMIPHQEKGMKESFERVLARQLSVEIRENLMKLFFEKHATILLKG
jgi:hypothetical protein